MGIGFPGYLEYNRCMRSFPIVALVLALVVALLVASSGLGGCAREKKLPEDPRLERFIALSARCAFVDRAFANDPELYKEELAEVNLPPDWKALVDSLLETYGTDADFWSLVYTEILNRSRK